MEVDVESGHESMDDMTEALLLCLVTRQHCIIETDYAQLESTARRLQLMCHEVFGLRSHLFDCESESSVIDLRKTISSQTSKEGNSSDSNCDKNKRPENTDQCMENVIIVKNLEKADTSIQNEAAALLRHHFRSPGQSIGKKECCLVVALRCSSSAVRMTKHLNDMFSVSHVYATGSSHHSRDGAQFSMKSSASINKLQLSHLNSQLQATEITRRGVHSLRAAYEKARMHRYVAGGISAAATMQLEGTCRGLAVLHGLEYVTPALVDMAIRKTYRHRLVLATRNTERSLQWGSDPDAVEKNMLGVTVDMAVDTIISSVDTPL